MPTQIRNRIFVVGCPRSGTTLLQSLIAAHPEIASFPESKFFNALISPGSRRSRLGIPAIRAREKFNDFLNEMNRAEMQNLLPKTALFVPQYAQAFIKALDFLAQEQKKTGWIEKTPSHIQRINCIEKLVAAAKFIHIIRNGEDVIASLYEVTHKYPDIWNGARSIDQCLQRWNNDVQISLCHQNRSNHFVVRYEELTEDPKSVLLEVCKFCNVQFHESMLVTYADSAKQVIRKREQWKSSVSQNIQNTKREKFLKVFNEEEQQYILDQLEKVSLSRLDKKWLSHGRTDCCLV
jgi:hypothetical protein